MAGTAGIMRGIGLHPVIEPRSHAHVVIFIMYGGDIIPERVMREYRGVFMLCTMITQRVM